jgi:hypothetical protein
MAGLEKRCTTASVFFASRSKSPPEAIRSSERDIRIA